MRRIFASKWSVHFQFLCFASQNEQKLQAHCILVFSAKYSAFFKPSIYSTKKNELRLITQRPPLHSVQSVIPYEQISSILRRDTDVEVLSPAS